MLLALKYFHPLPTPRVGWFSKSGFVRDHKMRLKATVMLKPGNYKSPPSPPQKLITIRRYEKNYLSYFSIFFIGRL